MDFFAFLVGAALGDAGAGAGRGLVLYSRYLLRSSLKAARSGCQDSWISWSVWPATKDHHFLCVSRCRFALGAPQQLMSAMFTDVIERAKVPRFIPTSNYALALNISGHVGARLSELFLMTEKLPAFMKNLRFVDLLKKWIPVTISM